jgi:hypothetical protein
MPQRFQPQLEGIERKKEGLASAWLLEAFLRELLAMEGPQPEVSLRDSD